MNKEYSKYIAKYALVLAAFYVIEYITGSLVEYREIDVEYTYATNMLILSYPHLLSILLNLVTALVVYRDIQKLGLKTKLCCAGHDYFSAYWSLCSIAVLVI